MSSQVPKKLRVKKPARKCLKDFDSAELSIIEAARSWFPGDIAVFGSRARGDWAADSDIDLGVQGYKYSLHKKVVQRLNEFSDMKVDVKRFEHALTHKGAVVV